MKCVILCVLLAFFCSGCSLEFREEAGDLKRELKLSEEKKIEQTKVIEYVPVSAASGSRWV